MPRTYPGPGGPLIARRYRRKRYYSTAQRILVHLATAEGSPRDETGNLTQEGIAATTLSARPTITKWLRVLERRGWVVRERARVPSCPLPRYVYRLQPAGRREAARIRERLASETVEVVAPAFGPVLLRVADIPALGSPPVDLTTVVSLVREGRVDLAHRPPGAERAGPLVWGESLRRVDRLYGREAELAVIDDWYASSSRVLLVTGLPGIGKSAVVAGWIQERRPPAHVFGFQVRRSSTPAAFLAELGDFLAALGRRSLAGYLSQGEPVDRALVGRLLSRDLARLRCLIVVESAEQASRDLLRFLRPLLVDLIPATRGKLVVVSRRATAWPASSSPEGLEARVLRLEGLGPKASIALLRSKGLGADEGTLDALVASTRGHPLLLHVVAQTGSAKAFVARRLFDTELWRIIGRQERRALEAASVLRRPAPARVLQAASGVRSVVIAGLAAKNLLEQTRAGGYVVHDLVRDVVIGRMTEREIQERHERVARVLLREGDVRDRWEGVYHLLAAGRSGETAAFLASEGAPLLDSVAAGEIGSLIRGMSLDGLDPASACTFSEILGDSLRIQGHLEPARFQYSHAMRRAETQGDRARVPRLLRKIASIERWQNRYPRALGHLVEARARLSELRDAQEQTEVLREMALVEEAIGEPGKAAGHLNEAIDLATEAADWSALCHALLALGNLEVQRGHRTPGLELCLEGLRIAERSGNGTQIARAHIVVGTALAEIGRLPESLEHYQQGHALSSRLGNLRLTAYAALNRTASLLNMERFEEAGQSLREAQASFGILEEKDTLGLLKTYEGQLEMGRGRWTRAIRAWEEGLVALREFGKPSDVAFVLKEVAGFCANHGDRERARMLIHEAKELAGAFGNMALISEVDAIADQVGPPLVSNRAD
ncbi:MAG: hypothetical protein A3K68_05265 [Euryarchaeota archaeon RBG_16_68_13]|nr:MAG: hypothetical protein A3K68_05265 [Euryarchaeota archaeon RBG_16_68_13]